MPETFIFSFQFKYAEGAGKSTGRVEATSAQHATERVLAYLNDPNGHGRVTMLANQPLARKRPFIALSAE